MVTQFSPRLMIVPKIALIILYAINLNSSLPQPIPVQMDKKRISPCASLYTIYLEKSSIIPAIMLAQFFHPVFLIVFTLLKSFLLLIPYTFNLKKEITEVSASSILSAAVMLCHHLYILSVDTCIHIDRMPHSIFSIYISHRENNAWSPQH